jgi:hypothetical protein
MLALRSDSLNRESRDKVGMPVADPGATEQDPLPQAPQLAPHEAILPIDSVIRFRPPGRFKCNGCLGSASSPHTRAGALEIEDTLGAPNRWPKHTEYEEARRIFLLITHEEHRVATLPHLIFEL